MKKISAERICLVLRQHGLPVGDVALYKPLVKAFPETLHEVVEGHLLSIITKGEHESIRFMQDLDLLARNQQPLRERPELSGLRIASTSEQVSTARSGSESITLPAQRMSKARTELEKSVIRKKTYVYGANAAFMFELDFLKHTNKHEPQKRTITVEAAFLVAPRCYDWDSRISFQLTQLELPQFTAVMFGFHPKDVVWEAKNHGTQRDKMLRAKEQGDSVYLKLQQAGKTWPVRVDTANRYQVLSLCLEALKHNDPHLDFAAIQQLCATTVRR